jgi:hypothetical protein
VQGGKLESLLERLQSEETKKQGLTEQLDQLNQAGPSEWDVAIIRREAQTRLADTRAFFSRQTSEMRAILKRLFDAPLVFSSVEEAGKVKFIVEGSGNLSNLLTFSDSLITPPSNVVSPTGCDRRWQRVPRTADVRMFPRHKSGSHGHRWLGTVGRRTSHVGSFSASRAIGECVDQGEFYGSESCTQLICNFVCFQ